MDCILCGSVYYLHKWLIALSFFTFSVHTIFLDTRTSVTFIIKSMTVVQVIKHLKYCGTSPEVYMQMYLRCVYSLNNTQCLCLKEQEQY